VNAKNDDVINIAGVNGKKLENVDENENHENVEVPPDKHSDNLADENNNNNNNNDEANNEDEAQDNAQDDDTNSEDNTDDAQGDLMNNDPQRTVDDDDNQPSNDRLMEAMEAKYGARNSELTRQLTTAPYTQLSKVQP
jgi:hypothetical protein